MTFSGTKPINETILYDSNGNLMTVRDGYSVSTYPSAIMTAGSDGSNVRLITLKNSAPSSEYGVVVRNIPSGTQTVSGSGNFTVTQATASNLNAQVVGVSADGATPSGNPVRVAGSDGSNLKTLFTDSVGRQIIIGASAHGTAVPNNPVSIGGSDGTNVRNIYTDASGRLIVNQGIASGLSGGWPTKITDGTNGPVAIKPASTAPTTLDQALVVVLSPNQTAIPITNAPSTSVPILSNGDVVLSSPITSPIRRTNYIEQSTNFTGSIASSNSNDSSAGTGARTVRIYWINSTGTLSGTEDVTLNGTTGVNLTINTKCYIEKIEVITSGSNGANAGIISLYTGSNKTGTVVGTISSGDNTTFWAHHYILSGKTCSVTGIYHGNNSTVSGGVSVAVLKSKDLSSSVNVEKQVSDFIGVAGAANPFTRIYGSVIRVAGPARLVMYVTSSSAATVTYRGSFDSYDE